LSLKLWNLTPYGDTEIRESFTVIWNCQVWDELRQIWSVLIPKETGMETGDRRHMLMCWTEQDHYMEQGTWTLTVAYIVKKVSYYLIPSKDTPYSMRHLFQYGLPNNVIGVSDNIALRADVEQW